MLKPKIMLNNNDLYTTSRIVTLAVWAQEGDIAYSAMKVWGTAEATEEKDASWTEYQSTQDIELPAGDGIKYIYVKVRDVAGDESDATVDAIALDTTVPPVTVIDEISANVHVVISDDDPERVYLVGPEDLVQECIERINEYIRFKEMDSKEE